MDFNDAYAKLATQLGDICYRLELMQLMKDNVLAQIKRLDELAGEAAKAAEQAKASDEANKKETQSNPS